MVTAIGNRNATGAFAAIAIMVTACSGLGPLDDGDPASTPALAATRSAGPLPLYGLARGAERGCRASGFGGFDFWVGQWDVFAGDPPSLGGTNIVTSELKRCAVEEHWADQGGGRGRSLNTYDRGTGQWNQLWMDFSGLAIILSGTASPGVMTMLGDTPTSIGGPIVTNRIAWTKGDGPDRVRQFWDISSDGRQTWQPAFDGDYQRRPQVTPAPEVINPFCASRPRFHWFDFLIGDWAVRQGGPGGESVGTMRVAKDLSDCLVESKFTGRDYQGKAFAAFHFPTLTWHRTWIDEDGVRLALTGQLIGTDMVMTGQRVVGGKTQDLRATWSPISANQVDEIWEVSTDGGATWTIAWRFSLTR